uniref:RNA helicase n=1 Tax=Aceria tosichella TaxID=561515 RepID=A0A6G1SDI1_9ACAR
MKLQTNNLTRKPYSKRWHDIYSKRTKLPVWEYRETFMKLLDENQAIVLVGETGSGKTTQVPQWCVDYCLEKSPNSETRQKPCVACTQPRRVAAISVATRVAEEMDVSLGQEVGYSVRFESCTSPKTIVKYLTDGMLLREAMLDGTLSSYGVIILDEAHERTLQTEILLGVVKRALQTRSKSLQPLKVILMSATINVKLFKKYFECPVLAVQGRQFQVQDLFAEVPQSDLLTSTLICVFQVHRTCDQGDILVFCSGQDEIQSLITLTKRALKQAPDSMKNLEPLPLYASLPAGIQMRVFIEPQSASASTNGFHADRDSSSRSSPNQQQTFVRRVIYATNVAETSVTIPNIKYVIDTGKVKCRCFCPKTGLESLKVTNVSKAQAKQRSGRAGRTAPGTCYRLYTRDEHANLVDHLPPEIRRCNLDGVILQMISIGIKNLNNFDFLERPEDDRLKAALVNLLSLKAIKPDSDSMVSHNSQQLLNLSYDLTPIGKRLSAFPLDPSLSRFLIASDELKCLDEALTVASLLSVENLFHIPPNRQTQAEETLKKFYCNEGDAIMLLNVYRAFKRKLKFDRNNAKVWCQEHFIHMKNIKLAIMIRKQLLALCKDANMVPSSRGQDSTYLRKALTRGFFNHVASMHDGKYRNKSGVEVHIHPSSCLFRARPEHILYAEVVETNKCYMRLCTLIDINWVREIHSDK